MFKYIFEDQLGGLHYVLANNAEKAMLKLCEKDDLPNGEIVLIDKYLVPNSNSN